MKPAKFLALVIFAALVMVSVPLPGVGSGIVNADRYYQSNSLTIGSDCSGLANRQRCAWDSNNKFVIVKCTGTTIVGGSGASYTVYRWQKPPDNQLITRNTYDECKSACSSCIEPYSDVSRNPNTNVNPGQQTVTVTSTVTYQGAIQSHILRFKITNSDGTSGGVYSTPCGSNKNCQSSNTFSGYRQGAGVEYWSDVSISDGTRIRNPPGTATYSFLLSSSTAGGGGSLTVTPSTISVAVGGTATATISGGSPSYSALTSNSNVVTATVSGTTLTVRGGTTAGTATITVRDSSSPQKTTTVQVTVTASTSGNYLPCPQGTTCDNNWGWLQNGQNGCGQTARGWDAQLNGCSCTPCTSGTTQSPICHSQNNNKAACIEFNNLYAIWTCNSTGATSTWIPSSSPSEKNLALDACKSACSSNYGGRCITPPGGTTPAPAGTSLEIIPASPPANSVFSMRFIVPSTVSRINYQILGPRAVSGSISSCIAVASGKSCTGQVGGLPEGDYTVSASVIENNAEKPLELNPNPFPFKVSAAGTTPSTGAGCCAVRNGDRYEYNHPEIKTPDECTQNNGVWGNTCTLAQNTACAQFCTNGGYGSGGTCNTGTASTSTFTNVCLNPSNPCRCTGQRSITNLPCDQACGTDSRVYSYGSYGYGPPGYTSPVLSASVQSTGAQIPIGQCTSNPNAIIIAWTTASQTTAQGGQYVQRPFILGAPGQYQCPQDESCVCTFINLNSFSASAQSPVRSAPGTKTWSDPLDISKSIPPKQPNQRDCSNASNATITASFGGQQTAGAGQASSTRLIQAGESVTITGHVDKLSDQCQGYIFTCRTQQVLDCDIKHDWWAGGADTSLEYKDCPAGTTQIHAEGKGRSPNLKVLGGAGFFVTGFLGCDGPCFHGGVAVIADGYINQAQCARGMQQNLAPFFYSLLQQASQQTGSQNNQQNNQGNQGNEDSTNACNRCLGKNRVWCTPISNPSNSAGRCLLQSTSGDPCDNIEIAIGDQSGDSCLPSGSNGGTTGSATSSPTFDVTGDYIPPGYGGSPTFPAGAPGAAGAGGAGFNLNPYAAAATYALSSLPACPSQADYDGCFSVCGKTYDTPAAVAPVCQGAVIAYKDATYTCPPGSCGGFDNKRVHIVIKGPDGSTAIDDSTTTDSNGDFSYTFTAPGADGEFTVIASVPRG